MTELKETLNAFGAIREACRGLDMDFDEDNTFPDSTQFTVTVAGAKYRVTVSEVEDES